MDIDDARELAFGLLAESLPRRWRHVEAVAAEAQRLADNLHVDRTALISAAWLHDIGYAPSVARSGFHPLDGARFLRAAGWPDNVCALVAHHTCSRVEAERRGFGDLLRTDFADRPGPDRDALWAADATTGPDGQRFTVDERVSEVVERYGTDHLVAQCIRAVRPELEAAVARTRSQMASFTS